MINNLYYGSDNADIDCFRNASFTFDTDVLATFLRRIYNGFDTSNDVEPTMWREILRIINEATVDGLVQGNYDTNIDKTFLEKLAHSNEVFSAFKVHDMGVDMAKKLVGDNGKIKPFSEWKKDIKSIASHYCGAWLQTEYNTATLRAKFAAEWKQYEADADIMPNLRWMPTTSANPEKEHKVYWMNRLTLPVGDRFWDKHHPGDHWNCKCSLEQTDEPANPDVLSHIPDVKAQKGLAANPGKTGEMFDETHPYIANAPKEEAKAVNAVIDSFTPAQTYEEAEAFAEKLITESVPPHLRRFMDKPYVKYMQISLESANEVNRALLELSQYGVPLPHKVVASAPYFKGDKRRERANAGMVDGELWLNPKYLKTPETLARRKKADNNKAKKTYTEEGVELSEFNKRLKEAWELSGRASASYNIREVVIHEFGHQIDHTKLTDKEREVLYGGFSEYGKRISVYAAYKEGEYFAESFLSYHMGEKIIDPELRKFFDSLKVKDAKPVTKPSEPKKEPKEKPLHKDEPVKFHQLDETTVHTRTIEGDDAQIRYTSPTGAKVVTSIRRLHKANASKGEMKTYIKEHGMAKVIADNGKDFTHRESHTNAKGDTFDGFMSGIPCDLKKTSSMGNLVQYAGYAKEEQGAKAVVFALEKKLEDRMEKVFEKFGEATRKYHIPIYYYTENDTVLRKFKYKHKSESK